MSLTYLNAHTFFSSAGGPHSPEEWCRHAANMGYSQLGIADQAPLPALPCLLTAARDNSLSPFIGVEVDLQTDNDGQTASPIILLPTSPEGLRNLATLSNTTYSQWPQTEKSVALSSLTEHSQGLILILSDPSLPGEHAVDLIRSNFAGRVFAGLPHSGGEADDAECARLVEIAGRLGLPIVALPTARYLNPDGELAYEALRRARVRAGWAGSASAPSGNAYLRKPEEAEALFRSWPEAIANNERIAALCSGVLDLANFQAPAPHEDELATLRTAVESRLIEVLGTIEISTEATERRYIEIEVPAERRDGLLAALAEERNLLRPVFAAAILQITPAIALQASAETLSSDSAPEGDPAEALRTGDWQGIRSAAQGTGPQAEIARLALSLKGAPVSVNADTTAVAMLSDGQQSLPVLNGSNSWVPWTCDALYELGYPVLALRHSTAVSILNAACALAGETPQVTSASEQATALLKKGEIAGIPYLSTKALKGWKGDFDLSGLAALVALSTYPKERPKAPDGIEVWAEQTSDTAGSLLYIDQFDAIVSSVAGMVSHEAAALRASMLNPQPDADGALRARFMAGCLQSGLEADRATELYEALSGAARMLVSRQTARSHALTALSLLELKAQHPAAFIAAWLGVAWEHGSRDAAESVVNEARRLGVRLLPPDVRLSAPNPTIEKTEQHARAVRWGLAQLPGWTRTTAEQFVKAREIRGCASLGEAFVLARQAELSLRQVAVLVQSGTMDAYGEREALHSALPSLIEWSRNQGEPLPALPETPPPSPLTRYLLREWEERNLGAGFTNADEMENLRKLLDAAGDLRSRLITTKQIGASPVGQSVCLVGLFCDIHLIDNPDPESKPRTGEEPQQLAIARVEDLDGDIELVAFPPNFRRHRELWAENNPLIITARVSAHHDGEVYLLCEHLAPFGGHTEEEIYTVKVKTIKRAETVPLPAPEVKAYDGGSNKPSTPIPAAGRPETQPSREAESSSAAVIAHEAPGYHLVITLPISNDDHADIDRMIALNRLLRLHPGPDSVTLRIPYSPESGAVTSAQLPRGVRYNPGLEEEIGRLLGPDSLALIRLVG